MKDLTEVDALSYSTNADGVATTKLKTLEDFQSKRFRYVAIDLDGTLLNSQHRLSEATIQYMRELDSKGFGIMVATGRALNTVYDTILDLNLPRPIPVVCSNGAKGVLCQPSSDGGDGVSVQTTPLFEIPVPEPVARKTIELAKELGFFSQYYVGDSIYADAVTPVQLELVDLYKELTGSKTKLVGCMIQDVLEQSPLPSKQLVLFPNEEQDRAMDEYEQALSSSHSVGSESKKIATLVRGNLGWFLEVLHPSVNKGNGLKRICDEHNLNVRLDEVVAFGDGDNDVEFLQFAGLGIAMKNARPVVKELAADVILDWTNDDDGVIQTLKYLDQAGQLVCPEN